MAVESASTPEFGRVLITGANGHLGRRLIARLSEERPVRAVVRSERAARTLSEPRGPNPLDTRILDPMDPAALTEACEACAQVVHLVGILKEGATSRYEDAHEGSSRALAQAAAAAGIRRIVYLSILGSTPAATNACLSSKGRAERILLEGETPALILRVPMVLGEGDFASRSLVGQARSAVTPLLRGGRSLEQPIYAGDVVEAIVSGLDRPDLDDVSLDLAGPECVSRRGLLERTARLLDRSPRVVPIPLGLNLAIAALLERISKNPPVTRAMLGVLNHDDDIDVADACQRLDIELTSLDDMLRRCVAAETT